MGRPKKNEEELLVKLTVDFYEQESGGDLSKLKYTRLAEYAKSRGYKNIEERHFRREPAVQEKVAELKSLDEKRHNDEAVTAYKNLDVGELLAKSRSVAELKRKISGLDNYWREVYERSLRLEQENRKLKSRPDHEKILRELETKKQMLSETVQDRDQTIRYLEKEITYLKSCLRKYLYPAVAENILKDEGYNKACESDKVNPKTVSQMIEAPYPQKYSGIAPDNKNTVSRIGRLLDEMQKEVDRK